MSTITIRGLTKRFEQHVVLQDLSLTIADGSFFTLLGPSGCGKTTLLRCIAGFNDPDGGSILFDDDDITRVPAHCRNIGMVFQDYALFPDKTVQDNVAYGLKARKVAADEVIARAHEALEQVGLRQYADRFPAQLSGGQRQRVALARALVIKPRVLLMDEPLSDQVAVMQSGRIAQMGDPESLYARPESAYVADFVGSANLLPVDYLAAGSVALAGQTLQVDTSAADAGRDNQLVLRAESLALLPREASGGANLLGVTLLGRQYLGAKTLCRVALDGGQVLQVDAPGIQRYAPGQSLWLQVPQSSRVISR